ncbi:glutamine synthetase family protein [Microvirga solisilvae]|uniref:glutamine synthetase family protein n=1 Tax=Microvirga solisilvae TaxID=2919498 RepID=UPI001FAF7A72
MSIERDRAHEFLSRNDKIEEIDLLITDLNGILRGKRVPASSLDRLYESGMKLPLSALALDIWGEDVSDCGLIWETGDSDGLCMPCGAGIVPVPWASRPRAQMLLSMNYPDGRPFMIDPRQVLMRQVERAKDMGVTLVVATELEFYLMDGDVLKTGRPRPPAAPESGYPIEVSQLYSMDELEEFSSVFTDIRDACAAQGIPGDTCIVENGPGQFEINLEHINDPVQAADQAVLFKRIVRSIARRHELHATFMPKPYGNQSGSGFHIHCSALDSEGRNIFDDGTETGSKALRHAVGGVLEMMPSSMLIFAPNLNGYRRFQAGTHAPTYATWGYENRTTSIRIPNGSHKARRFEHRVAGADSNPYLVLAAIIAGVLHGLQNECDPGDPVQGSAYDQSSSDKALPSDWDWAIDLFRDNKLLREYLGDDFHKVFLSVKWQERNKMARRVTDAEYATYLGVL